MTIIDTFLPEFDHEMSGTRSVLELVPDHLFAWQANDSMHTIQWNASHLADTLSWVEVTLKETSFDIAPVDGPAHQTPLLESTALVLEVFDQNLSTARALFQSATDEQLAQPWTLLHAGEAIFTKPRAALIKSLFINHIVHHRAFLIAYLRINDVQCPHLYG